MPFQNIASRLASIDTTLFPTRRTHRRHEVEALSRCGDASDYGLLQEVQVKWVWHKMMQGLRRRSWHRLCCLRVESCCKNPHVCLCIYLSMYLCMDKHVCGVVLHSLRPHPRESLAPSLPPSRQIPLCTPLNGARLKAYGKVDKKDTIFISCAAICFVVSDSSNASNPACVMCLWQMPKSSASESWSQRRT